MQFRRILLALASLAVAALVTVGILRSQPGPVSATAAAAVTAGVDHTCALSTAGGVTCSGINFLGQLGDGTNVGGGPTPVEVSGLSSGVAAVTAGYWHTCALTTSAGLKCWGSNRGGQLGAVTTESCGPSGQPIDPCSTVPVDVTGLTSGVAAVAAGGTNARNAHTCALTTTGGLKCWGSNAFGQLGDGTMANSATPVDVSGLTSGVAAVSAGGTHTCALTTDGGVKCWGNNRAGQLGAVTTELCPLNIGGTFDSCSTVPVDVTGLESGVAAVSAGGGHPGGSHTCALTTAGGVKCWGAGGAGQLGDGTATDSATPVDVSGLASGVAAVSAGELHTCALNTAGGAKCWGYNLLGQIGDGTFGGFGEAAFIRETPVAVSGLASGVAAVSAGGIHTCALLITTGGVKCWGGNLFGQLGTTTTETCGNTPCSTTPLDVLLGPTPTPCPAGKVPANGGCGTPTKTPTQTPTPCPTAKVPAFSGGCGTPTSTPTPKDSDADTDGDTIPNSSDPDDDNDGCTDVKEIEPPPLAAAGGGRNPHNFWDFFDVWTEPGPAKDVRVDGFDINAVALRFGTARGTPPTKGEAFAEALTPPTAQTRATTRRLTAIARSPARTCGTCVRRTGT